MSEKRPDISVVIPVYQAEGCLEELCRRLKKALKPLSKDFEIILVEDCSADRSWDKIVALAAKDPRVVGIQFSRNFGQHRGITAGLDLSRGRRVVIMDCDLQDRPEEIPRLYAEAKKGFDVVLARRINRQDSFLKRLSSTAFYTLFNYLTDIQFDKDVAGFCLLSRRVVDAVTEMREADRFLMAFVQWVGFPVSKIEVQHDPRYAGETSYSLMTLLRLTWDTSIAFSNKPLKFAIGLGFTLSALSLMAAVYVYALVVFRDIQVTGWASTIISLYFLGGLIIANLGVVGLYLGKVYTQTKQRPLYVVRRSTEDAPEEA